MKKQGLHAIAFAWPGQGHLNPLLRFSELLAMEDGCKVTFVHSHQNLARMKAAAGRAQSRVQEETNNGGRLTFVGIDDGLPEGHARDVASLIDATDAQRQGGLVAAFDSLVARIVQEDAADVAFIVSDLFMCFTQDVANKYGLPRVAVFVQSAASFACHVAVAQGFRPLPGADLLNCLPGVLPSTTRTTEMVSFLQCYDPSDPLFDYMMRSFHRLSEPAWIVFNTFDELEHDAIDHIRKSVTSIKQSQCGGPLLPWSFLTGAYYSSKYTNESMWEEDHQCLQWLDEQAPSSVLFIAFGSLATISARQAEEFAIGLEDSKVPFLWVLREGLIEDGHLPDGFVERVKERAYFVSWAPQMKVLAHPSVGGFLTHCGWNSVMESIGAGVPMLGWSWFAEQKLNRRCIMDSWGLGLSLSEESNDEVEQGFVARAVVEKKVRALMLELPASVRRKCASLKEAAAKAAEARHSALLRPLVESLQQQVLPR